MIVGDIFSNLGNQLFAYAATKSIALDLGYKYGYRVIKPGFAASSDCLDAYGHEYTKDFERAFHIDTSERIDTLPNSIKKSRTWERTAETNFIKDVYNISDSTRLDGYFLCPKYFEHRREQVLQWFCFREEYLERSLKKRNEIIEITGADHLVSIHVRCGKDYRQQRQVIDISYYLEAVKRIKRAFPKDKLCFLIFSDVTSEAMKLFNIKSADKNFIMPSGTMFEDLCLMTLCDSHIISNSTFSWWGAWLASSSPGIVIRPSVWPTAYDGYAPNDVFPDHWSVSKACREKLTFRIFIGRLINEYPSRIGYSCRSILGYAKKSTKRFISYGQIHR